MTHNRFTPTSDHDATVETFLGKVAIDRLRLAHQERLYVPMAQRYGFEPERIASHIGLDVERVREILADEESPAR